MAEKVLVIEDEDVIQEFLIEGLKIEGYNPVLSTSGKDGLKKIKLEKPDIVVLDLGLPDLDGIEVCRQIKSDLDTRAIPVIIVTGRTSTGDRVTGLEAGADDYIIKPFDMKELAVRIKALFRRLDYYAPKPEEIITKGGITINVGQHKVTVSFNAELDLSPKEFQLLYLLMKNSGRVLERGYLLKTLWGYTENTESRTVDVHIQRLRKKIEEQAEKFGEDFRKRIVTMEGIGYKFEI